MRGSGKDSRGREIRGIRKKGEISRTEKKSREAIPPESPRPAWLMETPLELKLQRQQPVYGSPLKLIAGPERIEAGWWDDALIARDYFIAENDAGPIVMDLPGT